MPALPSDAALLPRLQAREDAAFAVLYRFYYPPIERFVRQNSGTAADAADVFQETLLVLLDRVPTEDFQLTSSLKTYLFAIASNIWLKRLRTSRRLVRAELGQVDTPTPTENPVTLRIDVAEVSASDTAAETEHRSWLIEKALSRVTAGCYKLLRVLFFFAPDKADAVAWKLLGYKNAHSLDNQKYKCLEQARRPGA
jgi:RNA polymerase sigma factor (sigma-70 family)